jgi:hypothetical protein
MIQFDKPEVLNGEQLIAELKAIGVIVNDKTSPSIEADATFWLDIPVKDKSKAEPIVAAHVGIDTGLIKATQRQAIADRLGLTADELKVLLG